MDRSPVFWLFMLALTLFTGGLVFSFKTGWLAEFADSKGIDLPLLKSVDTNEKKEISNPTKESVEIASVEKVSEPEKEKTSEKTNKPKSESLVSTFRSDPFEERISSTAKLNELLYHYTIPTAFPDMSLSGDDSTITFSGEEISTPLPVSDPVRRKPGNPGEKLIAIGVKYPSKQKTKTIDVFSIGTSEPFAPNSRAANLLNLTPENFDFTKTTDFLAYPNQQGPILRLIFQSSKKPYTDSAVRIYDKHTKRLVSSENKNTIPRKFRGGSIIDVPMDIWTASSLIVAMVTDKIEQSVPVPLTTGSQVQLGEARFQIAYLGPVAIKFDKRRESKTSHPIEMNHPYPTTREDKFGMFAYRLVRHGGTWGAPEYRYRGTDSESKPFFGSLKYTDGSLTFSPVSHVKGVTMGPGGSLHFNSNSPPTPISFPVTEFYFEEKYPVFSTFPISESTPAFKPLPSKDLFDASIPYMKIYKSGGSIQLLRIAAAAAQCDIDPNGFEKVGRDLPDIIENTTPRQLIRDYEELTGLRVRLDESKHTLKVVE